jgi:hypothetical protein
MENQTNPTIDCGCSNGCCTPHKNTNPLKKWIFIGIVLAAGATVTVKLVSKCNTPSEKCCETTECGTTENTSCCP